MLTYKELHSIRWLSYYSALQTVHRTIDSLLTYFTEVTQNISKDPKANGLKKKIGTVKFISITALMMDAMAPVTILSQFLQTENVDIALVKVKLDCHQGSGKDQRNDLSQPHSISQRHPGQHVQG